MRRLEEEYVKSNYDLINSKDSRISELEAVEVAYQELKSMEGDQ